MKKKIKFLIANPAGNITLFVLDYFEQRDYQAIASQLLAREDLAAEQVAFVAGDNKMNMCGMEFCGNASRAFALMVAKNQGIDGYGQIEVSVSGCDTPLTVAVNTKTNFTRIKMPPPLRVERYEDSIAKNAFLVDMGGIIHIVVKDLAPTLDIFDKIKDAINEKYNPPAMGVMFYDTKQSFLTPVVYVKDVDSTYFEGSCGSGTTAVAAAFSAEESYGTFGFTLPQPAGTITSTVEKTDGKISSIYIEGNVSLGPVRETEIDSMD